MRRARLALLSGAILLVGTFAATAAAAPADIDRPATAFAPARRLGTTGGPTIAGCPVFPSDNPWNTPIDGAPLHPRSNEIVTTILANGGDFLHPDFGENPAYGIPYVVVPPTEPRLPIAYDAYGDESDPGPFPIPQDAPVEGGAAATGDRHVIAVQQGTCELFELFAARPSGAGWIAAAGARFDLRSNALQPARLDERRRRRPADPRRPRPLRRGGGGPDPARDPHHRSAARRPDTSCRRPTSRRVAPTRTSRRWACGCG